MNMKNNLEVIIDKKRYTIGGYVSEDYLQKTATFINAKIAELQADESYRHLDKDLKAVLLNINLADEYFKLLEEKEELLRQIEEKNLEIFTLKHDLAGKSAERNA